MYKLLILIARSDKYTYTRTQSHVHIHTHTPKNPLYLLVYNRSLSQEVSVTQHVNKLYE